ncbi:hypothetical protein Taro_039460 [Colocasia esculenta]|uniref:Uncharacterized protein n=1 Tax=Colocasia esculenta TaxID=4460 RepID=A0A843W6G6_COLES|nr:hypothetical protein [Colocasia esculenta]
MLRSKGRRPLRLLNCGRSGPARVVSISDIEASFFGVFNFIAGILILGRSCLAKLAFQPSNTFFSCGHPQLSRLLTLAHFSNPEITGFSVALQSFNPPGPGRFDLTGVHPVPNIGDKIHPTLLLDSHAKGRSGMLLQRLSNNFNRRRVRGIHQCRYSANKEFPAAIISKMRGWLHPCGPSYTMLRRSTNLQGWRAVLARIWHSICPRKEISSKEKAVSKTKLSLKVERDWMVQDTDLERSWENIADLNKIAPHYMGRLEGHRYNLPVEGLRLHLLCRPLEKWTELGNPKTGSLKFPNSGWRSSPLRQNMNLSFPSQTVDHRILSLLKQIQQGRRIRHEKKYVMKNSIRV